MTVKGSCLCGAVRYEVDGPLRDVSACHCTQCRKQSGHHVAATSAAKADLTVEGQDRITWFSSSPGYRRGFCGTCGSHLFWDCEESDKTSIFAGSLDDATGLKVFEHIFVADKGDYYEIADDVPKFDTYPG